MRKMAFALFTSLAILFVIWTIIIASKNNWNVSEIRFSLRATMEHITTNIENNMQEAFQRFSDINADLNEKYEWIKNQWENIPTNDNWFDGFEYIGGGFTILGTALLSIFEYFVGIVGLIVNIIIVIAEILQFLFNPVTY